MLWKQSFILCVVVWLCIAHASCSVIDRSPNRIDADQILRTDNVCSWSRDVNGFGMSGSQQFWYNEMRQAYNNCTYVDGNLLVSYTDLPHFNYDYSFLHKIRYVRGHVIIILASNHADFSMPALEIIRGNRTFTYNDREVSLVVGMTNFTAVRFPRLKEISRGDVVFRANKPGMIVEIHRQWDEIMAGRITTHPGSLIIEGVEVTSNMPDPCSQACPRRCFMPGDDGCCSDQCAGGCFGPLSTQCEICKDFSQDGDCVSYCSFEPFSPGPDYYRHGRLCLPLNTTGGFR